MFEDIHRNKIKSAFIILIFFIFMTVFFFALTLIIDSSTDFEMALYVALTFSITLTLIAYRKSNKIILTCAGAKPATEEENTKLVHILDALMIPAGLSHRPELYVIHDSHPNAFATGHNSKHSIICVTTGLLDKLDYYELESVLAHEIGHIKNYDILLTSIVSVMFGFTVMLASHPRFLNISRNSKSSNNNSNALISLLCFAFIVFSPLLGKIIQMSLSRQREFLADATSVEITRNPQALISALRKLDSDPNELQTANKAVANLYFATPFKKKTGIFDTHPSIEDRIKAIENIS